MNFFIKLYKFLKLFALIFSIYRRKNIGAPIVVSRDRIILDGNTRLIIAKELGIKKVPVVFIDTDVEYVDTDSLKEGY